MECVDGGGMGHGGMMGREKNGSLAAMATATVVVVEVVVMTRSLPGFWRMDGVELLRTVELRRPWCSGGGGGGGGGERMRTRVVFMVDGATI